MSAIGAVLLDALGTLVELRPPGPRLRTALLEETGVDVGARTADAAFAAEIAFYLEHQLRGGTEAGLEGLRDDCAAVLHDSLGRPGLERAAVRRAMIDALAFRPFADVAPALEALRARGLRLVVASNWDCSLGDALERCGLAGLVDGYVSSAVIGASKPDPAVFGAALEIAGVEPARAVHVGDSLSGDVAGARAAGIRAILVRRVGPLPAGIEAVRSLEELPSVL